MNFKNYTKRFFWKTLLTFVLSLGIITPAYAANVNGFNYGAGDILVDNNNCGIGLLFSTSDVDTAYNRLSTVFDQLYVNLPN